MLKSEITLENMKIQNVFSNLIIDVFNHETTIKNIIYRVDVSKFKDPKDLDFYPVNEEDHKPIDAFENFFISPFIRSKSGNLKI
jgi:hypothetical protein